METALIKLVEAILVDYEEKTRSGADLGRHLERIGRFLKGVRDGPTEPSETTRRRVYEAATSKANELAKALGDRDERLLNDRFISWDCFTFAGFTPAPLSISDIIIVLGVTVERSYDLFCYFAPFVPPNEAYVSVWARFLFRDDDNIVLM